MSNRMSEAAVLETREKERIAAMVAGDAATLDGLLHEQLVFGHTNGHADDKGTYLAKFRAGTVRYADADLRVETVTLLGETALVRSELSMRAELASGSLQLHVVALTVWRLEEAIWRMVAHQPTVIQR